MKKLFILVCLLLSFSNLFAQKEKPGIYKKTTNISLKKLLQYTINVADYNNYSIISLDSLNKNFIRVKLKVEKQSLKFGKYSSSLYDDAVLKIQLTHKIIDKAIPPPPIFPFEDTLINAVWEIVLEKQEDANHSSIQITFSNITKESLTKVKNIVKKESPSDDNSFIIVAPNNITSELVFEKELAESIINGLNGQVQIQE